MAEENAPGVPPENAWQHSPPPSGAPWQQPQPPDQPPPAWASPTPEYGAPLGTPGPQAPPLPPAVPWGYPGHGQPVPARKSHTGLIVGLAIGVMALLLVGAGAVAVIATASGQRSVNFGSGNDPVAPVSPVAPSPSEPSEPPDPEPATFRLPASAAGYKRETGSVARRLTGQIRKEMGKAGPAGLGLDKAHVAIYMKGVRPLVFMGFSGSEIPQLGTELKESPSGTVDQMFLGAGFGDAKDYTSGVPGSVLRCGTSKQGGTDVAMCAWADRSALLLLQGSEVTPARLSSLTRSFREASLRRG